MIDFALEFAFYFFSNFFSWHGHGVAGVRDVGSLICKQSLMLNTQGAATRCWYVQQPLLYFDLQIVCHFLPKEGKYRVRRARYVPWKFLSELTVCLSLSDRMQDSSIWMLALAVVLLWQRSDCFLFALREMPPLWPALGGNDPRISSHYYCYKGLTSLVADGDTLSQEDTHFFSFLLERFVAIEALDAKIIFLLPAVHQECLRFSKSRLSSSDT